MLSVDARTWEFSAENSSVARINGEVEGWLTDFDVPFAGIYLANLGVEELVTNCIKYGYPAPRTALGVISLTIDITDGCMTLTLTDDAALFNPTLQAHPDLTLAIEDRPIGGLGLHMLRQMTTEFTYVVVDGRNQTTLKKILDG